MGRIAQVLGDRVYVDANIVVYCVEGFSKYAEILLEFSDSLDEGSITAVTSALTVAEVMVKPKKLRDAALETAYRDYLIDSPSLHVVPISVETLEPAAEVRADNRVNLADAIHQATAIAEGCTRFLTNDLDLKSISGCNVVQLSRLATA